VRVLQRQRQRRSSKAHHVDVRLQLPLPSPPASHLPSPSLPAAPLAPVAAATAALPHPRRIQKFTSSPSLIANSFQVLLETVHNVPGSSPAPTGLLQQQQQRERKRSTAEPTEEEEAIFSSSSALTHLESSVQAAPARACVGEGWANGGAGNSTGGEGEVSGLFWALMPFFFLLPGAASPLFFFAVDAPNAERQICWVSGEGGGGDAEVVLPLLPSLPPSVVWGPLVQRRMKKNKEKKNAHTRD
jgi:hypothetical protein